MKVNIERRNSNSGKGEKGSVLFGLIFFLCGLVPLIVSGYSISNSMKLKATGEKALGVVKEIDSHRDSDGKTMYAPIIEFQDKSGKTVTFKHSISSSSNSFSLGEQVEVIYTADKPEKAKLNTFFSLWGFSLIFMAFGVIFGGIGALILYALLKRKKDLKFLNQSGQTIKADVSNVDLHKRDKSRDYWTINAQWHDNISNKIYTFESDPIYFNPQKYVSEKIDVIIDPNNPKKYTVDLSSLPEIVQ